MWLPEPVKAFLVANPPKPLGVRDEVVDSLTTLRDSHKRIAKESLDIVTDLNCTIYELCPHSDLTVSSQSNEDEFGRLTAPTWLVVCKKCGKVQYDYTGR